MDGWMDGWMDGRKGGRTEVYRSRTPKVFLVLCFWGGTNLYVQGLVVGCMRGSRRSRWDWTVCVIEKYNLTNLMAGWDWAICAGFKIPDWAQNFQAYTNNCRRR